MDDSPVPSPQKDEKEPYDPTGVGNRELYSLHLTILRLRGPEWLFLWHVQGEMPFRDAPIGFVRQLWS